jgi:hypothetical protein
MLPLNRNPTAQPQALVVRGWNEGAIMADDKVEPREINWRQLLPWTAIFQGFRVALDPNKLLLAALGIAAMALVWWFLAWIFYTPSDKPAWHGTTTFAQFKQDRQAWNLLHEAAGYYEPGKKEERYEPEDLADSVEELEALKVALPVVKSMASKGKTLDDVIAAPLPIEINDPEAKKAVAQKAWQLRNDPLKPYGKMRTLPFSEDRGANPYLLVMGREVRVDEEGTKHLVPWEKGQFVEWFTTKQAPVLLEPLIKMLRPVVYFLNPNAGAVGKIYFLLVMIFTVAIWGVIGGAITRIAAVQVARQEKIGIREALSFATKRYLSFISAPMVPLIIVLGIVLIMILFGVFQMIPVLGDLFDIFWVLMIIFGLFIAGLLLGLLGWPLMSATISTEGTDSWEAVSRSFSYVFGAPWHYIFYSAIALLYGAVLIFFVGFMGSAAVYFAKWGVQQTPWIRTVDRDPSYLFAYAPTSYEWRTLLLKGAKGGDQLIVDDNGRINQEAYKRFVGDDPIYEGPNRLKWYNQFAAFVVMLWLWLFFLLILGFGYSYFWTASTIIYFLMRRKVDDTEMDEVYLEEEEQESPYSAGAPIPETKPAPAMAPAGGVTMVEAPTLRTQPKEETPAPPPSGDGNPPPSGTAS